MWFKKYSVCSECKVHFEPDNCENRFAHLCISHRKPAMELARRKDAVMAWAASNWEKLEAQYKEDDKINTGILSATLQNAYASSSPRETATSLSYGDPVGNIGRSIFG